MRRIRSSDTKPERMLAQALALLGLELRRNASDLPGTPDLVHDQARVAVFVHGCFWHACPMHCRVPDANRARWVAKFARTSERDLRARMALECRGWRVFVVWEHDLAIGADRPAREIARAIRGL